MNIQYPDAVLWDMDGTIIDTEPAWIAAETELVESFGGAWSIDDGQQVIGFGLRETARVLQLQGVSLGEDEIIDRLTTSVIERLADPLPWRPGALQLMQELQAAGVKQALVTMSFGRMAQHVAAHIDFKPFSVVVSGDSVVNSKPHPEPYLLAAEQLGVAAADCVAIEDSPPGIASAVAAGTAAIGIPHQVGIYAGAGYSLWETLEGRTGRDIALEYMRALDERQSAATGS